MKRILFAWELGGNWGHLARSLPIALALRERGYEVCLAVSDTESARDFLQPQGLAFVPAPKPPPVEKARRLAAPESYAGVLTALGYGTAGILRGVLHEWLQLFESLNPAVIVADFAPGAMVAARAAGRVLATIGLGFDLPPPVYPLPPIRPWENRPAGPARAVEDALLETVNGALTGLSAQPVGRLHELFPRERSVITSFPELDHYGVRAHGIYTGPVYSAPANALEVHWPSESGRPRLLAYLRAQSRGMDAMLVALQASGTTVACIPGPPLRSDIPLGSARVYREPLRLEHLLPEADLVVTNGNITTSTRALLAGVPVLAMPNVVEQHLGALRILDLGAGLIAESDRSQPALRLLIQRMLAPAFKANARLFAQRYANETVGKAVARVVAVIEGAARSA